MMIQKMYTMGRTVWETHESRYVSCGRGGTIKDVLVRDKHGKPCERAKREAMLVIHCDDLVSYALVYCGPRNEPRRVVMFVHGMKLHPYYFDIPQELRTAFVKWRREIAVCERVCRKHIQSLPTRRSSASTQVSPSAP